MNNNNKKSVRTLVKLTIKSSSLRKEELIPERHTRRGGNLSPDLAWSKPPEETRTLLLILTDPDAPEGTFTHWLVYNIPPQIASIGEGLPRIEKLTNDIMQGRNDFGQIGYDGPAPPPGKAHRYIFTLFALNIDLQLSPGIRFRDLENLIQDHILAEGKLETYYQR